MKTQFKLAAFALLFTLALHPSSLLAQGSLTPPGPPAPTMKTLQQVEPRVPISSAPFIINQPGSYYLTTNLTVSGGNAIIIAAYGVTLDLNGFTISSTANPASGSAVLIASDLRNIAIQNGHIQGGVTNNGSGVFDGPGFENGISYFSSMPQNVRVSGVSVSGCLYYGINVGFGANSTVENCVVRTVGSLGNYGIIADTIQGCMALDCGGGGIYGLHVSDSRGESVYGPGLFAEIAQNCYGVTSIGAALVASTAQNCYGYSTSGTGLHADSTAIGCYGESITGQHGLYADNANTCTGYRPGGTAIQATIANGCWAAAGTNSITHKYNMP